jgi:hypothetical protein
LTPFRASGAGENLIQAAGWSGGQHAWVDHIRWICVNACTTLNLRKFEAHRLMKRGYEILHIERHHRDDGDETAIVWTRPARPDDIPECQVPY